MRELSVVESMEPKEQLLAVDKLRSETTNEAERGRPAAFPLLIGATLLFFSAREVELWWVQRPASLLWCAFLLWWLWWLRSENRVRGGWKSWSFDWRHYLPGWIVVFMLANAVAVIGNRVSWVLGGVLMAGLVAYGGQLLQRLARR